MPRRRHAQLRTKDIMRRQVVTVDPEMTVPEVMQCFLERQITGAPVVDEDDKLVGVISQTDLLRYQRRAAPTPAKEVPSYYHESNGEVFVSHLQLEASAATHVQDLMTPAAFTTEEDTPIREIARFMLRRRVHRIIVTRRGKVRGIVTSMDLLRALVDRRESARPTRTTRRAPRLAAA